MTLLLAYAELKTALAELPHFPALKTAVSQRVNALAPKPTLAEIEAETHGVEALATIYAGYRRVKRQAVKAAAWGVVAEVMGGVEVNAGFGWEAVIAAATAVQDANPVACGLVGIAALESVKGKPVAGLPAINEEVW